MRLSILLCGFFVLCLSTLRAADVNNICPVTLRPVNPAITQVYEGQTIAFADEAARGKWMADREKSLYQRMGGKAVIEAATESFYVKALADGRIKRHFENVNVQELRGKQGEFLAAAFGGPNPWAGKDMRTAHAGLKLNEEAFKAFAENLRKAFEELNVSGELVAEAMAIVGSTHDTVLNNGVNWPLLLPSTWNPATAGWFLLHGTSGEAAKALSDVFITVTVYLGAVFLLWSVWLTLRSWWRASRYRMALRGVEHYAFARQKLQVNPRLPLFRGLHHHLVEVPLRDGSNKTESRRTVEAAEVFTDELLAPGLSTSRVLQALPGTLTGLGVLGTFVGLQIGIGGLELTDLKKLETSIVPLIQGCAIAFSTSVWGVTASLGFSLIEKALESFALGGVRKLQARVDSLIPRYVPEEAMAELERSSRGSEELLKGLAVAIGDQMQMAIGRLGTEIKDAVVNATREGQGPLAEQSAQLLSTAITAELGRLKETIGQMSEQFNSRFSSASDELMRSVQSFQPTVTTLSQAVSGAQQTVTNAVERLNAHEGVMGQMAEAAGQLQQASAAFERMRQTLENSAMRNEEAAKAQHTAATANQEVAAKFDAIGERLPEVRQTIEDAARVIGSLGAPISEMQTLLAKQPELHREIEGQRSASEEERSTRLLNLSKDLAATVAKAVEEFAKVGSVAHQLSAASNSLNEASNELAVFGQQVLEASKEQRAASEASRDAANASERTTETLGPLPEAFKNLAGGLTQAGASVKEGAKSAAESYRQLVELQRLWFDGAKLGLNAMKERLQEIIGSYGAQIEGQTKNLMNQWTQQVADCLKTYENQVETLEGSLEELQTAISKFNRGA